MRTRGLLIRQGTTGTTVYVLAIGQLQTRTDQRAGGILRAGDYVGQPVAVDEAWHSATVRALTPARLFAVPGSTWRLLQLMPVNCTGDGPQMGTRQPTHARDQCDLLALSATGLRQLPILRPRRVRRPSPPPRPISSRSGAADRTAHPERSRSKTRCTAAPARPAPTRSTCLSWTSKRLDGPWLRGWPRSGWLLVALARRPARLATAHGDDVCRFHDELTRSTHRREPSPWRVVARPTPPPPYPHSNRGSMTRRLG